MRMNPEHAGAIRLATIVLVSLVYMALLGPLALRMGDGAYRFGMVPVLLAAFFWGRRGLWAALGITLFNTFFVLTHLDAYGGALPLPLMAAGTVTTFLLALLVGTPIDMHRRIRSLNAQLRELSLVDPLTSLYNRRFADEVVSGIARNFLVKKTEADVRKRNLCLENKVMAVFVVDIDNFKRVNDEYGHAAGDQVLVSTSALIKRSVRFDDMVIRWGGEEFLVFLVDTAPAFIPVFAEKLRAEVEANDIQLADGARIRVTVSSGCLAFPLAESGPAVSFEECVNLADRALYHAKAAGRNRSYQVVPTRAAGYRELCDGLASRPADPGAAARFQLVAGGR